MSGTQKTLSREDYVCAKSAVPVVQQCDAATQELFYERIPDTNLCESGSPPLRRSSTPWIIRNPSAIGDRSEAERTSQLKCHRVARASSPGKCRRSESRQVSVPEHEPVCGQSRKRENESVAAQIRRFQERADLRECLLPGMLSRISRKACEGWQRQASVRTSKMMSKIKLESCRRCPYGSRTGPGSVTS